MDQNALRSCWKRGWSVLVMPDDLGTSFVAKVGPTDRSGRTYCLGYGHSEEAALSNALVRLGVPAND